MDLNFKTPRSILNLYKDGFVGSVCDEEDTKKLLGELPMPVFGAAAYDLQGSGEGKLSLPFKSLLKFDSGFGQYWGHYQQMNSNSKMEKMIFQSQWDSMKEGVVESMKTLEEGAIDLGKLVPLVDVSGSMSGDPMEVAIALGILVSEVNDPHFRNRFITFESNPRWISFEEDWSLEQKVNHTRQAPWGGSTDLSAALNMIYNVVEENRLSEEEIPNLIIFSDMQFNQCSRWNETMQQTIERKFATLGNTICGKPYRAPLMIYWNLRSTEGHAVQADTPNTMLLSGFSPSMLKLILEGQQVGEQKVVDEKGNVTKKSISPWEINGVVIASNSPGSCNILISNMIKKRRRRRSRIGRRRRRRR